MTANGTFQHEAMFYAGDDEFADGCRAFVEEGLQTATDNLGIKAPRSSIELADRIARSRTLHHLLGVNQFFVDLHAHTPGRKPTDPAVALSTLLLSDGLNARDLPADLDGRGLGRP